MKKSLKPRSTVLTVVVATVLLVLFGGGAAVAGGLITSAKIKNNTIQSIDVKNNALTGADVKDGSLGGADAANESLTGADVKDGSLTGADVKDGSLSNADIGVFFAKVGSGGSLISGSGDVTATRASTGVYKVRFAGKDLTTCAFSATLHQPTAGTTSGMLDTADLAGDITGIWIDTRDVTGTLADRPFSVIVVC